MARPAQAMTPTAKQLDLFADFVAPVEVLSSAELVAIACNDEHCDDDPLILSPVVHRIISASMAEPLFVSGPRSVFDMAGLTKPLVRPSRKEPSGPCAVTRVHRSDGVTRCIRIQIQETPEWQAREAARRARQKPPKPTAKAKTKSRKLIDMVGA